MTVGRPSTITLMGVGFDRVARPDDDREKDVGQLDGMDGSQTNIHKDVEKGEP
jgi:hypothetical protein